MKRKTYYGLAKYYELLLHCGQQEGYITLHAITTRTNQINENKYPQEQLLTHHIWAISSVTINM